MGRLSAEELRASLGKTESGKFEVVENGFGGTTTRRVEPKPLATPRFRSQVASAPPPATKGQKDLLREMLAERAGNAEAEEVRGTINAAREANALSFPVASAAITALKLIPRNAPAEAPAFVPRPNKYAGSCEECGTRVEAGEGILTKSDEGKWEVAHAAGGCPVSEFPFPFGSYAIDGSDGLVKFYAATTEGLFVQASDALFPVSSGAQAGIIAAIAEDPEAASRRYGREIGACGRCGRTLTDTSPGGSRDQGIGPVCAGKGWVA